MTKFRAGLLAVVVSIAALALVATAMAAFPKANTTYTGESKQKDEITAKTGDSRKSLESIKVHDDCDGKYTFKDVKINSDGKFKATYKFDTTVVFKIKGTFKSKTLAKGKISSVTCSGEDRGYTIEAK